MQQTETSDKLLLNQLKEKFKGLESSLKSELYQNQELFGELLKETQELQKYINENNFQLKKIQEVKQDIKRLYESLTYLNNSYQSEIENLQKTYGKLSILDEERKKVEKELSNYHFPEFGSIMMDAKLLQGKVLKIVSVYEQAQQQIESNLIYRPLVGFLDDFNNIIENQKQTIGNLQKVNLSSSSIENFCNTIVPLTLDLLLKETFSKNNKETKLESKVITTEKKETKKIVKTKKEVPKTYETKIQEKPKEPKKPKTNNSKNLEEIVTEKKEIIKIEQEQDSEINKYYLSIKTELIKNSLIEKRVRMNTLLKEIPQEYQNKLTNLIINDSEINTENQGKIYFQGNIEEYKASFLNENKDLILQTLTQLKGKERVGFRFINGLFKHKKDKENFLLFTKLFSDIFSIERNILVLNDNYFSKTEELFKSQGEK